MSEQTTIERAFELARGGTCRSVDDIRRKLTAERHSGVDSHLAGRSLRNQLKALMTTAKT